MYNLQLELCNSIWSYLGTISRILLLSCLRAIWHDMTCECGYVSNMLVKLPDAYDRSILVSNQSLVKSTAIQIYFLKTVLFSVWIPNSKERKSNPRKPYLGVLVRIAESLYSGGRTPASRSVSAYVGSGMTSYSASGSESTVSPILI
jgi:hypothetical protein